MTVASETVTRVGTVILEGRYVRLEPLTPGHARALAAAAAGPRETYALTTVPEGEPVTIRDASTTFRGVAGGLHGASADLSSVPGLVADWKGPASARKCGSAGWRPASSPPSTCPRRKWPTAHSFCG